MLPPKGGTSASQQLVSQAWCLGSGPSAVGSGCFPLVSTPVRGRQCTTVHHRVSVPSGFWSGIGKISEPPLANSLLLIIHHEGVYISNSFALKLRLL